MGRGYNTQFLLYPLPMMWWISFLLFYMCHSIMGPFYWTTPFWWHIFSKWRYLSLYEYKPCKRHLFVRKHVVWAIKCENRSNGSTWTQDREKGQEVIEQERVGQSKSHKGVIFQLIGEKLPLNRFSPKFAQYRVSKKLCKIVFVRTLSNFHQFS